MTEQKLEGKITDQITSWLISQYPIGTELISDLVAKILDLLKQSGWKSPEELEDNIPPRLWLAIKNAQWEELRTQWVRLCEGQQHTTKVADGKVFRMVELEAKE